jgi:thiamine-monophosphate kinase
LRSPGSPASSGDTRPGERALIHQIRQRLPAAPPSLIVAPGDDAAVVVPERGAFQVLTTDALVEGIHFDRRFSSLADIGYKALAVNVSDIAAMGAKPEFGLLSLILPDWITSAALDELLDGLLEMAALARVSIAGGNISRSPGPLIVDVSVTGSVRPRRILTRGAGKPGDALYVTGAIGAAAAGLAALSQGGSTPAMADCIRKHQRPEPRLRIGMLLGRNRAASACMDLSDGLADAVRQIAEASGTGAAIDASLLPVDPGARMWFESQNTDPITAAVTGGDDFELLFAVPRKRGGRLRAVKSAGRGVAITKIGELTTSSEVVIVRNGLPESLPQGFQHF